MVGVRQQVVYHEQLSHNLRHIVVPAPGGYGVDHGEGGKSDYHHAEEFQEMVSSFEINQTCPLYGTKVPFAGGEVGKMEEVILDSYGLTKADFEVPKMPRLGSHGLRRAMRFQVWDASAKAVEDGVMCEFSIDKGSYATAVLREVMKKDVY